MVDVNIKLPDGFLDEEIRCGYKVSHKMKEVWAIELDLLNELLQVCDKYKIEIFANGGTMLGAARHQGFIPWDDDIDTMLTRVEYNKLCSVAEKEFTYPYFFQTEYTDPGSLRGHAQLRRIDTTGALKTEVKRKDINQGIFIDIFPLDLLPNEKAFSKWRRDLRYYYINSIITYKYNGVRPSYKFLLKRNIKLPYIYSKTPEFWYGKFEDECNKYNSSISEYYGIMKFLINQNSYDYKKPVDLYKSTSYLPFEMLRVPVPEKYEDALTAQFGDWHKYEKGGSVHGEVIFDTNRGYKELLNYSKI